MPHVLDNLFTVMRADAPALCRSAAEALWENPRLFCKGILRKTRALRSLPADTDTFTIGDVTVKYHPEYAVWYDFLYYGCGNLAIRNIMESTLRSGDTFIDVGANIGCLSAVALSLVGTAGKVHSFEPAPHYHALLAELAQLNPNHCLVTYPCALGEQNASGSLSLSRDNISNNSLIPQAVGSLDDQTITVPIRRLDDILLERGLHNIALIKIDTEGYEPAVLHGLETYFRQTDDRPAILCELNPPAYETQNTSAGELAGWMRRWGYDIFSVLNPGKRLHPDKLDFQGDVLFRPATPTAESRT